MIAILLFRLLLDTVDILLRKSINRFRRFEFRITSITNHHGVSPVVSFRTNEPVLRLLHSSCINLVQEVIDDHIALKLCISDQSVSVDIHVGVDRRPHLAVVFLVAMAIVWRRPRAKHWEVASITIHGDGEDDSAES